MSLETLTSTPDRKPLKRIPPSSLAYLSQRARNNCYHFVMKRFEASGLSKADLGRRIGKGQDQINHVLASPGNWTIRTLAELLAGIGDEEFIPSALSLHGRPPRNMSQFDLSKHDRLTNPKPPAPTGSGAASTELKKLEPVE